jgi:hypothetical protein
LRNEAGAAGVSLAFLFSLLVPSLLVLEWLCRSIVCVSTERSIFRETDIGLYIGLAVGGRDPASNFACCCHLVIHSLSDQLHAPDFIPTSVPPAEEEFCFCCRRPPSDLRQGVWCQPILRSLRHERLETYYLLFSLETLKSLLSLTPGAIP